MWWFTNRKVQNNLDESFIKLLEVQVQNLTRSETISYLNDYKYTPNYSPVVEEGAVMDYFEKENTVPLTASMILFSNDTPVCSVIHIAYPGGLHQKITELHRDKIDVKLKSIIEGKFGSALENEGLIYWQKGFTMLTKNYYDRKGSNLGIKINMFNLSLYPFDQAIEDLNKSKDFKQ